MNSLMTWQEVDKRWHKKYHGKKYAVSPRQLGTLPTKAASYQAANDWWTEKVKELEAPRNALEAQRQAIIDRIYAIDEELVRITIEGTPKEAKVKAALSKPATKDTIKAHVSKYLGAKLVDAKAGNID